MASQRAIPVVIGVGDINNKSTKLEDAIEPMKLMLQAIELAINDTQLSPSAQQDLQSKIDSIDCVATWTMPYPDLPGLLAKNLGINPKHKLLSAHHGDSPAMMFDDAARRISLGESRIAVVTGGEALASCLSFLQSLIDLTARLNSNCSGCICSSKETTTSRVDETRPER